MPTWTSCCRDRRTNCPSVAVEGKYLLIKDDDGAQVRVKLEAVPGLLLTVRELAPVQEAIVALAAVGDDAVLP